MGSHHNTATINPMVCAPLVISFLYRQSPKCIGSVLKVFFLNFPGQKKTHLKGSTASMML